MTVLREDQLYTYATQAGFTGGARDTIVAISEAESGGNTNAVNKNDPYGGSFGVLQINGAHMPPYGSSTTQGCAYDPACSFRYAYQLSSGGTDFHDWGSYTSGAYAKYLNPGGPQYTKPNAAGTQPSADVLGTPGGIIAQITEHSFLFLLALAIIGGGVLLLVKRSQ